MLRAVKQPLSKLLDVAGVPNVRAVREHNACWVNPDGVPDCTNQFKGPPQNDCRRAWCPHAAIMRMRLLARLRDAYAPGRRKLGKRSY